MGGMRLLRGESEDQSAVTRIHGFDAENLAKKCMVCFGVFTVDNHVSPKNHLSLPKKSTEQFAGCMLGEIKLGHGPLSALRVSHDPLHCASRECAPRRWAGT